MKATKVTKVTKVTSVRIHQLRSLNVAMLLIIVCGAITMMYMRGGGSTAQAMDDPHDPHSRFLIPSRYFEQSGHNVGGAFLAFFEENGGVEQFGLPLTDAFEQDGVQVQYFEHVRLEIHPNASDHVKISPLGVFLTQDRTDEMPFVSHDPGPYATSTYFPSTGHNLSYQFRTFWQDQGAHRIFGLPISEPFLDYRKDTDTSYTVQYFEQARLEYHLDHPGGTATIQFGDLGREYAHTRNMEEYLAATRPITVLGSAKVTFTSSSGIMRNIRLAVRQFNNLRVAPGEELSFLDIVGELTSQTGYVAGGGIVGGSVGQVIAGGICYLSTGVYQAVLRAGLEITERHPHSLALGDFQETPGLDSAVYTFDGRGLNRKQNDMDLRWRNDTPDPIILETKIITDGELMVALWGYSDGRTTTLSEPEVNPRSYLSGVWRYDSTLPQCEVRRVAAGSPGMSVTVERVVESKAGEILHRDTIASTYGASRDVYIYGPNVTPLPHVRPNPGHQAYEQCLQTANQIASPSPNMPE